MRFRGSVGTVALLLAVALSIVGVGLATTVRTVTPADVTPKFWPPDETHAPFALKWHNEVSRLRIVTTSVSPGEVLHLEAINRNEDPIECVVDGSDRVRPDGATGWAMTGRATPGLDVLHVRVPETHESIRLNVFTTVPREQVRNGCLNGYRIGDYPPTQNFHGVDGRPPAGFVEVTEANASTPVSPRFSLDQFLCKQEGGFPKYVVLNDRLPLKLEALLDRVREEGFPVSSLHVMSGYRTPAHNRDLGNVDYSRHMWGAAADVLVDESPHDGRMDDLNRDGRVDRRDAEWLAKLAVSIEEGNEGIRLKGGVGEYGATEAHGPYVHVDVRRRPTRW